MAESNGEIYSTVEIPFELNSIEESGAEQQPVQPVDNQVNDITLGNGQLIFIS
jgi:hypothetical protein